jgi:hypothetical protein
MAIFTLTTNADTVAGGAADDTVNGTAATLNASDSLTGGSGFDTLALSGSGSFRVDQLATFAEIERITLNNATNQSTNVTLGNQPIEVDTTGNVSIGVGTLSNWNGSNTVNGDATGNTTALGFYGSMWAARPTYDLTSNAFSHVKIDVQYATLLINSAAMAGIQSVSGDSEYLFAHLVTADSTLDLSHTSVYMGWNKNGGSGVTSTNASGTTFTVSDFNTAMEIFGGPGQDTLIATGFTLDAYWRNVLLAHRSIEKIIDPSGIYGGPGADTFAFDPTALPPSGPAIVAHIVDFDQGNSGAFNLAEGDTLDLSAVLSAGSGQPVGNLIQVLENPSHTGAIVQVDKDGITNGAHWTTIALLDGVHAGNGVKVIFDASQPAATLTVRELADAPRNDFNGDGTSDVFWRNDANGHVGVWEMRDNKQAWLDLGGSGVDHKVAGVGDFNGDGTSDLFWRDDSTGHVGIWEMHNYVQSWRDLGNSGADHKVVGVGDFNGDGTSDLLWRNDSSGHVGIWEMHNSVQTWRDLGASGVDHKVVGIGDFNADGTADVLWRNDPTGHVGIWEMHNDVQTWRDLGGSGVDHKVVGIGDFNGDGTSDILWRNDLTGHVGIWEMHNNVQTWRDLGGSGVDHKVVGTGDYNGDGTTDIFWRNDAGHTGVWEMHNNVPAWHDLGGSGVDHSFII